MKTIDAHMASVIELDLKAVEKHVEEHPPAGGVHVKGGLPVLPLGEHDSPVIMPTNPPEPVNPWSKK
jgi:hypothetical protein